MGLCNSPDICQEKMKKLFNGPNYVGTNIDDLLIIRNKRNKSWKDQIKKLDKFLIKLNPAGFKVILRNKINF